MKYNNPKNLALLSSFILSVVVAAVYILISFVQNSFEWVVLFLIFVFLFSSGYLIFQYILERFIYEKIKLIYKTILSQKATAAEKKEKMQSGGNSDVIEEVNQQVLDWASDRRKEIERLKELADYRREYVGNVSHELKTPIFNIQGYVLTLLDGGLE